MKKRPDDMLIYYGWLNSFNSASNSWDNEKVAQDLAKYDVIVLGDGIQSSGHGDYANTTTIIPRIKELNPNTKIFGYVTVDQTYSTFKTKVDEWETLEVHGIFLDEAGYDFGKTRSEFNDRVDYVHSQDNANICFVNAWNFDHVLGVDNDASYPNTTYNSDELSSNLEDSDYILLESLAVNTDSYANDYEAHATWRARLEKAIEKRVDYSINLAACCIINDSHADGADLFSFAYISALMGAVDVFGSSSTSYGAGTAASNYWTRPDVDEYWEEEPEIVLEGTCKYLRYLNNTKFVLDFTSSSEDSAIESF